MRILLIIMALLLVSPRLHGQLPNVSGITLGITLEDAKARLGSSYTASPLRSSDPTISFVQFVKGRAADETRSGWLLEVLSGRVVAFSESVWLGPKDMIGYQRVMQDVDARYGQPTYADQDGGTVVSAHYLFNHDQTKAARYTGQHYHDFDPCYGGRGPFGTSIQLSNNVSGFIPTSAAPRCLTSLMFEPFLQSGTELLRGYLFTMADLPTIYTHIKQMNDAAAAKANSTEKTQQQRGLPQ